MRVLRVYHSGRNPAHRARDRALLVEGLDVTLVVPAVWPEEDAEPRLSEEAFPMVELATRRAGDVNRHAYDDPRALARLIGDLRPDLLDVHEEPYSLAARQWVAAAPADLPIVMYTSQNIDKRLPPPFFGYERRAHERSAALYPCSAQAASVARGKGFSGHIEILPLGYEAACFSPGAQSLDDGEIVLALVGRLVPEKGVLDAVRVLAGMNAARPTRLVCIGSGPEEASAKALAARLGLTDRLEVLPWLPTRELAQAYRLAHVVLVTSLLTSRWVEQFGRVIVEAQASGAVVAGYASGSIPEVAGPSAVLAPVGDVDRLTRRVAGLLSDPVEYARRRAEGRASSSRRTWERVAERHAYLYRQVLEDHARRPLPRSPRTRRAVAAAEFGPPAMTVSGSRPFGLPILRRGGVLPAGLAAAIDLGAETAARARGRLGA